jgi:hypothetical protein
VNLTGAVIHTGWRAIAKRLGVRDPRTARSLVKRYRLPVFRIGKSPRLDEAILRVWIVEFTRTSAEAEDLRKKLDSEAEAKGR